MSSLGKWLGAEIFLIFKWQRLVILPRKFHYGPEFRCVNKCRQDDVDKEISFH